MKNDKQYIEKLLEKFMSGDTTLEEEVKLGEYFRMSTDIPEEWKVYQKMFAFFDDKMPEEPIKKTSIEHSTPLVGIFHLRKPGLRKWLAAACAVLLIILFGLGLNYDNIMPYRTKAISKKTLKSETSIQNKDSSRTAFSTQAVSDATDIERNMHVSQPVASLSVSSKLLGKKKNGGKDVKPKSKASRVSSKWKTITESDNLADITQQTENSEKTISDEPLTVGGQRLKKTVDANIVFASRYSYTVTKFHKNSYDTVLFEVYYSDL